MTCRTAQCNIFSATTSLFPTQFFYKPVGHGIGNEAGALDQGNGVGDRARGPVPARKSGRRGHDRRTVREARDPGQGHEIGPRGRTDRADVTEETTGKLKQVSDHRWLEVIYYTRG